MINLLDKQFKANFKNYKIYLDKMPNQKLRLQITTKSDQREFDSAIIFETIIDQN